MEEGIIVGGVDVSTCQHFDLQENGAKKCKNIYCPNEYCAQNTACDFKNFQTLKAQPDFYKKLAFNLAEINNGLQEKYNEITKELKIIIQQSDICQIPIDKKKIILYHLEQLINGEMLFTTCTGVCDKKKENTKLSCPGCIAMEIKRVVEEI